MNDETNSLEVGCGGWLAQSRRQSQPSPVHPEHPKGQCWHEVFSQLAKREGPETAAAPRDKVQF
jgi:hypothetical protein